MSWNHRAFSVAEMTTELEPNRCSTCDKTAAKCNCAGCKSYFCVKHFNEHRQQLSVKFDDDIVKAQGDLVKKVDEVNQLIMPSTDLLSQIDQWENETIANVHKTAEKIRSQLTELVNQDRTQIRNQFDKLTKEIVTLKEDDDFAEDDIIRLHSTINQIQKSIEQLSSPGKAKYIIVENSEFDWDRLISIEEKPKLRK